MWLPWFVIELKFCYRGHKWIRICITCACNSNTVKLLLGGHPFEQPLLFYGHFVVIGGLSRGILV